ncbi:hypothetical protein SAMN05216518_1564 [Bacteroidales bacterium KHT7]|nr:hypothetical protein SAMN05216518_1564 [Bacteroidales bacterium KHT7]
MRVEFNAIDVGCGDCLFLLLENEGATFNIMIDCGNYDKAKDYIMNGLHNKIDLLIVTHIDNDHVPGLTDMINKNSDIIINKILFNCYQREPIGDKDVLTDEAKHRLLELKGNIPIIADAIDSKIDAEQARLLSEAILNYESRIGRKIWERSYITCDSPDLSLNEWGNIKFLSPSQGYIEELDILFKRMFRNLMFDDIDGKMYDENSSIYEIMMHYMIQENLLSHPLGTFDSKISSSSKSPYTEESIRNESLKEKPEPRIENKASIAFAWEYQGCPKMFFFGDADALLLERQIKAKYTNRPIALDLIKISHHGSLTNTTKSLLNEIDAKYYVLSGGKGSTPNISTMAKIIVRPLIPGVDRRVLYYTKATPSIKEFINNKNNLNTLPDFDFIRNEHPIIFTY